MNKKSDDETASPFSFFNSIFMNHNQEKAQQDWADAVQQFGGEMFGPAWQDSPWQEVAATLGDKMQKLAEQFMARQSGGLKTEMPLDPFHIRDAFMALQQAWLSNPKDFIDVQQKYLADNLQLWQNTAKRFWGLEADPIIEPDKSDKRFKSDLWQELLFYDFLKQSYLLSARALQQTVAEAEGLDEKTTQKLDFYTRQLADAMAPGNYLFTNPEVMQETLETRGENLIKGMDNLLRDVEAGQGELRISMTDESKFELGKTIAPTKGDIVFRNELMELIYYTPQTKTVRARPLLLIPPWINKFYILDISEKNSLIGWLVKQGFSVFCISWVNPDEHYANYSFDDYMIKGPLTALEVITRITGAKQLDAVGYCLGGTLLACLMAWLGAAKDDRIASATFFTTMVDFEKPGELGVFIDENQLNTLEQQMSEKGYLDGSKMASTFNMLRANDLIWSFVINNYLLGRQPFPFDLLYWNADSTRMPAKMHSFYLRNMYLENRLIKPGSIHIADVPIDLGNVKTPVFILSTKDDHIAPWQSTYSARAAYGTADSEFVLAGSGHIAGVVNPPNPDKPKYGYWVNDKSPAPATAEDWFKGASQQQGSWWPHWQKWLMARSADMTSDLPNPKAAGFASLGPAPGDYVRVRSHKPAQDTQQATPQKAPQKAKAQPKLTVKLPPKPKSLQKAKGQIKAKATGKTKPAPKKRTK